MANRETAKKVLTRGADRTSAGGNPLSSGRHARLLGGLSPGGAPDPGILRVSLFLRNNPSSWSAGCRCANAQSAQRRIITLSFLCSSLAFILPGLDRRFGWSDVPAPVVIAADLLVLLGYGLIVLVFRENQYASRTVQVEQGQQVISSGPYALVRHPMYRAMTIYLASPLALGSYWGLIPALAIVPILVARIANEERMLNASCPATGSINNASVSGWFRASGSRQATKGDPQSGNGGPADLSVSKGAVVNTSRLRLQLHDIAVL
jgi:protein-S-isoprenylcysteine O-methyltransferase Ste14